MTFAIISISANAEWRVVREVFPDAAFQTSPYGEWFEQTIDGRQVIFFQSGWGKVTAAASTQYALLRWNPGLLVNLGTCGGLSGQIERGTVILVNRTIIYDIIEQMSDPEAAIRHYSVDIDLGWLKTPYPQPVLPGLLVSADRDICVEDIPMLRSRYQAVAADWESGAIAWVCHRNAARCLILRGVSDLVGQDGGQAYDNLGFFHDGTRLVMKPMLDALPGWLACIEE